MYTDGSDVATGVVAVWVVDSQVGPRCKIQQGAPGSVTIGSGVRYNRTSRSAAIGYRGHLKWGPDVSYNWAPGQLQSNPHPTQKDTVGRIVVFSLSFSLTRKQGL